MSAVETLFLAETLGLRVRLHGSGALLIADPNGIDQCSAERLAMIYLLQDQAIAIGMAIVTRAARDEEAAHVMALDELARIAQKARAA